MDEIMKVGVGKAKRLEEIPFRLANVLDTKATELLERLGNLLKLGTFRNRAVEDERPVFLSWKPFLKIQPRSHHWNVMQAALPLSKIYKVCSHLPHLPSLHLPVMDLQSWRLPPPRQWAATSRGGLETLEILGSKTKPDPTSCPAPGDSPSHMRLRPAMCWGPGRGKASEISLFFLHPPATTLSFIFYSLMTWSFFRSNQSQYNASPWMFVMTATMMRNMAKIIISFHHVRFYFVLFLVQIAVAEDLFPWTRVFRLSLSLHTLTHLFFLFPQRPLDTLKSVLLDSILVSYLVCLPFLPSRFLLISHKESVSRQTSVTE